MQPFTSLSASSRQRCLEVPYNTYGETNFLRTELEVNNKEWDLVKQKITDVKAQEHSEGN